MNRVFVNILVSLCLVSGCRQDFVLDHEMREKQKLESPLSSWLLIDDVNGGQVIRPTSQYQWTDLDDKNVFLNANGKLEFLGLNGEYFSSGNLGSAHVEKLLHSYLIERFNKKLKDNFDIESNFNDIYHLRVFSTTYFAYDLMIYAEDDGVNYISVCLNYCESSVIQLIKVSRR